MDEERSAFRGGGAETLRHMNDARVFPRVSRDHIAGTGLRKWKTNFH